MISIHRCKRYFPSFAGSDQAGMCCDYATEWIFSNIRRLYVFFTLTEKTELLTIVIEESYKAHEEGSRVGALDLAD